MTKNPIVCVQCPKNLFDKVKSHVKENGLTMTAFVHDLFRQVVEAPDGISDIDAVAARQVAEEAIMSNKDPVSAIILQAALERWASPLTRLIGYTLSNLDFQRLVEHKARQAMVTADTLQTVQQARAALDALTSKEKE